MQLIINDEQDKHLLPKKLLQTVEKVVYEIVKTEDADTERAVGLIFVDNDVIRELNRSYRGIDSPTDVLSFALDEGEDFDPCPCNDDPLGDIYISVERAVEQAEEYGHGLEREICFLALHGMLHLLGYDHQTEAEEKVMQDKIEKILAKYDLVR